MAVGVATPFHPEPWPLGRMLTYGEWGAAGEPGFRELIRQTQDIFVQAILDLKVPQMVFGRVLLTGDAAFVPRPHTAGSTAKAARNALALAQAIDDIGDLDKALLAWQHQQLAEGMRMADWG